MSLSQLGKKKNNQIPYTISFLGASLGVLVCPQTVVDPEQKKFSEEIMFIPKRTAVLDELGKLKDHVTVPET